MRGEGEGGGGWGGVKDRLWGHTSCQQWPFGSHVELFCNVVSRFGVFYFFKGKVRSRKSFSKLPKPFLQELKKA